MMLTKKKTIALMLIFIVMLNFSACELNIDLAPTGTPLPSPTPVIIDTPMPTPTDGVAMWWKDEPYLDEYDEKAAELVDDSIKEALNAVARINHDIMLPATTMQCDKPFSEDDRAYSKLNDKQKMLFDSLLEAGRNYDFLYIAEEDYGPSLVVDFLTVTSMVDAYDPYLQCYFTGDFAGNDILALYFDPDRDANFPVSTCTVEFLDMQEKMQLLDAVIKRVVRKMPAELSTYDKYYYLGTVVATRATYNSNHSEVRNCSNAYGCLVGGQCLCEGYSEAFFLLCREANLFCHLISGFSRDEGHMWNVVEINGWQYHFDTTWASACKPGSFEYDILMGMTNEECENENHTFDRSEVKSGLPLW